MEPYANALNTANTLLGGMAAALMTVFWLRVERTPTVGWWTVAAWCAVPSIALVVLRPWVSPAFGVVLSTTLYTAAHLCLLIGVLVYARRPAQVRLAVAVAGAHLAVLWLQSALHSGVEARMLANSSVWAVLSWLAVFVFRGTGAMEPGRSFALPQGVLIVHGGFHVVRAAVLLGAWARGWELPALPLIQSVSFIETGLFIVGIFSGLLMLCMLDRNRQLARALAEVRTLSGLLPICAGCKKIRDEKGYWSRVEEYLEAHTDSQITHGLCNDCGVRLYGREMWERAQRDHTDVLKV
ncbi:MAG: hypothetical protein HYV95_13535 [Opitutae bacterium]|nr:hypothetical protein [Opitutae bacterium]